MPHKINRLLLFHEEAQHKGSMGSDLSYTNWEILQKVSLNKYKKRLMEVKDEQADTILMIWREKNSWGIEDCVEMATQYSLQIIIDTKI